MAIKVEVKEKKNTEFTYPFIGITKRGTIVLFNSYRTGTVLKGVEREHEPGYCSDNWAMTQFEKLNEIVEMSNN